ncbi:RNA/RNP complex-1-interacting phosphatase-like [Hypanus sabinus]|uniref:RNA/RNP complex-1-interacting phosphatase-like n=1 Tax=Hypanus sabinus TaxID=79690 RepID=UPI0028C43EAF|nr:RNA/RNP complex-1-interacting phosphatase-like [Hypanus sabinus]
MASGFPLRKLGRFLWAGSGGRACAMRLGGLVAVVVRMEREWFRSGGKVRGRYGARGLSGRKAESWAGGNGAGSGKNRIPDRWQEYSAVGQRLPGTRFIAFKVPLKKVFESRLMPHEIFSPTDLLKQLSEQHQELGKIIDLTFTKRYYDSTELPEDLQYEKIFTAGHEVPSAKNILSFKQAVKTFLLENMDNDKLVGVHCTHGVNRTGYLICRYLVDVDGMDPHEAIDLFNRSRGHPIERQNYIQDLLQGPHRSNKGIDIPTICTKQMGQFSLQSMSAPQDRAKQAKYPARNDCREFSHFVYPPDQSANSYLPMRHSRGNSAVHQPVLSNGQYGASSDHTGRWQQSSWRNHQAHSSWQHYPMESPWGKDQPLHPWAGYQQRAARRKNLISQGQVGVNTHLRWDD